MRARDKDLSGYYVWFDTEFTSLDIRQARLLQVAMVVTDARLQRVGAPNQDVNLVINLAPDTACDPWVARNLAGLVKRSRGGEGVAETAADALLAARLDELLGAAPAKIARRPVLAGNSLQADWQLAERYLPQFFSRLNYRVLDVSSLKVHLRNRAKRFEFDKDDKALLRRTFPGEFNSTAADHDAHFDVLASIAELHFYDQALSL